MATKTAPRAASVDYVDPERADVIRRRGGNGKFAGYAEAAIYSTKTGKVMILLKIFVCGATVSTYKRSTGREAGRWDAKVLDSPADAHAHAIKILERLENGSARASVLAGDPLLVELSEGENEAGTKTRLTAMSEWNKLYGKVDDDTWTAPGWTPPVSGADDDDEPDTSGPF